MLRFIVLYFYVGQRLPLSTVAYREALYWRQPYNVPLSVLATESHSATNKQSQSLSILFPPFLPWYSIHDASSAGFVIVLCVYGSVTSETQDNDDREKCDKFPSSTLGIKVASFYGPSKYIRMYRNTRDLTKPTSQSGSVLGVGHEDTVPGLWNNPF